MSELPLVGYHLTLLGGAALASTVVVSFAGLHIPIIAARHLAGTNEIVLEIGADWKIPSESSEGGGDARKPQTEPGAP